MEMNANKVSWFCLISFFIFLTACTHIRRDGPPGYYVDEKKIPNATPKVERLSRYGNLPSYVVFGKKYHVLKSSKNYEERGIASWYGSKFHQLRTSSGERYNMLSMTAAHKTLPLPTYVEVTNLANGRKIIVKVNDRGPFEGNRLIDLSYVAAKKLGMLGRGTARVDVKAIDPLHYNRLKQEQNAIILTKNNVFIPHAVGKNKKIYLQVGAFRQRLYAERLKIKLHHFVNDSSIHILLTQQKKWYRVQIGPLKDIMATKHLTKRLQALGLSSQKIET